MKNQPRVTFWLIVCAMIGLATLTSRSALSSQGNGGRLDGTWNVVLTPRNCVSGDPLPFPPPFPELVTFMTGGTMLDSTSFVLPAAKTPGQGVWSHMGADTYQYSFKSLSFGPDPSDSTKTVFTGWTIVSQEVQLNSTATEYTSSGTAQFYNTSGVAVGPVRCSTTTASRFE